MKEYCGLWDGNSISADTDVDGNAYTGTTYDDACYIDPAGDAFCDEG